jgi:hypothetical protein
MGGSSGLDSLWPGTRITGFRVLGRLSAAGVPATTLQTVESLFDAPVTDRRSGWGEAGTGPGSLVLVTGHGAGLDGEPDHQCAVVPGVAAGWPPGGAGCRCLVRACRSSG